MRSLAVGLLLGLAACGPKATPAPTPGVDQRAVCCSECSEGASTDPQGRGLDLLECGGYAVTDACREWFSQHPTFVQDCR